MKNLFMKKGKLFLLSTSQIPIPSNKGGAIEKLLFEIYKVLKKEFNIYIISSEVSSKSVKYRVVKAMKLDNLFFRVLYEFYWGLKLSYLFWKEKPDIVHINTPFNSFFPIIMRFFYPNTKFIYTSHNPSWTVPDKELSFFNILIEKIESFVMRRSDVVVAVSNTMKEGFIKKAKLSRTKIKVIYNFVDTKIFSPRYGKVWKKKNRLKGPIVLYVGKLTETKGVSYLIRSIPYVAKEIPNVNFVFVGGSYYGKKDNPYLDMIDKLEIKNNVFFVGPVNEKELPLIYSSADVFVLPSMREAFGLVVVEALSSGVPVIVSKLQVFNEILNNEVGFYVPRNSPKHIACAIIKLLKDNNVRKKMSKNAKKRAIKFDKIKQIKKYKILYESLLTI